MVHPVCPPDSSNVQAVPTIQDGLECCEHRCVISCEREPYATILVSRPKPTVPDEPAQCEAEFAGPFRRKVEDRRLSVRSDVQLRGSKRQSAFLREASLSRLDQKFQESWYQAHDSPPTRGRQH